MIRQKFKIEKITSFLPTLNTSLHWLTRNSPISEPQQIHTHIIERNNPKTHIHSTKHAKNLLHSRAPNSQSRGVVRRRISDAAWRRLLDRAYAPGAAPPPPWAVDHAGFPLGDPHVREQPRARLRNSAGVGLRTRRALPWVRSAVVFCCCDDCRLRLWFLVIIEFVDLWRFVGEVFVFSDFFYVWMFWYVWT